MCSHWKPILFQQKYNSCPRRNFSVYWPVEAADVTAWGDLYNVRRRRRKDRKRLKGWHGGRTNV